MNERLTVQQLMERWGKAKQTLAKMRFEGTGPRYIRIGRTILYPLDAVEEFERGHMHSSTRDLAPQQPEPEPLLSAEHLHAQGHSAAKIARVLGRSVADVRNELRQLEKGSAA